MAKVKKHSLRSHSITDVHIPDIESGALRKFVSLNGLNKLKPFEKLTVMWRSASFNLLHMESDDDSATKTSSKEVMEDTNQENYPKLNDMVKSVSSTSLNKEFDKFIHPHRKGYYANRSQSETNLDLTEKSEGIPHFSQNLSVCLKKPSSKLCFSPSLLKPQLSFESFHSDGDTSRVVDFISVESDLINESPGSQEQLNILTLEEGEFGSPKLYTYEDLLSKESATNETETDHQTDEHQDDYTDSHYLSPTPEMSQIKFVPSNYIPASEPYTSVETLISRFNNHSNCETSRELPAITERLDEHTDNADVLVAEDKYAIDDVHVPEIEVTQDRRDRSESISSVHEREVDIGDLRPPVGNHNDYSTADILYEEHERERFGNANNRDQQMNNVHMRFLSSRNGELTARCKSQVILKDASDDLVWSRDHVQDDIQKNLSFSSPSVNSRQSAHKQENECRRENNKEKSGSSKINRSETQKWVDVLPFGPRQIVTSSFQFPSRISLNSTTSADLNHRLAKDSKKPRIEKRHARKGSTLLDFFRKPDIKNLDNGGTHVEARRSTVSDDYQDHKIAQIDRHPYTIGPSDGRIIAAHYTKDAFFVPQKNKSKWADLDLWSEDPPSWSVKHMNVKLSKRERKKQDVIFEVYTTEKHHCQVLVTLQQVYEEGLRYNHLLTEAKREALIPGVLDALLDFHLSLLRSLRAKINEKDIVDSISQIISSQFGKGEKSLKAAEAYVEFCSRYDRCGQLYDEWKAKFPELRKFFDEFELHSEYKERSFKMCLLLIAQRITKYPVLLEKLSEVESNERKADSQKAYNSVKRFAQHINNDIAILEVNRRWDELKRQMDKTSRGKLSSGGIFSYIDLVLSGCAKDRRVICIGGARIENLRKKSDDGKVMLVLFDDIIIFLTLRNDRYVFLDRGNGCTVIELSKLFVRNMPRSNNLHFVVSDAPFFDLFVVSFNTKTDMEQWKRVIDSAKERAPPLARRAIVLSSSLTRDGNYAHMAAEFDRWEQKLQEIFERCTVNDKCFTEYFKKRLSWFETLRAHIRKFPVIESSEANRLAAAEKVKALIKQRFVELRMTRKNSLSKVAEHAEKMYEDDFMSFFDEMVDGGASTSDSTDQSETEDGRKLPRRNRTFNGIGEHRRGSSVRRHTTEPKVAGGRTFVDDDTLQEDDLLRLPLRLSRSGHHAATKIMLENAELREENKRLLVELAHRELYIVAMKNRRLAATATNALEELRKRQLQLEDEKSEFASHCEKERNELRAMRIELQERDDELKAREEQLREQWKFYEMNGNEYRHGSHTKLRPVSVASYPTIPLDRSNSVRTFPLFKSSSSSAMPLHLAEKTATVVRPKK